MVTRMKSKNVRVEMIHKYKQREQSIYATFVIFVYSHNFFINSSAWAQDNCVTSECHVEIGRGKYLHGLLAAKDCKVCHIIGGKDSPPNNTISLCSSKGALSAMPAMRNMNNFYTIKYSIYQ